jgi:hypothetical protein
MFLKPRKESTDQRVRSLLQKAVRRGFTKITDYAITRLEANGDNSWLRSRAIVITFEECWPLAESLFVDRNPTSKHKALENVALSIKHKDAAGLGALAYAYMEGDSSMLNCVPDEHLLKIISKALQRPKEFFKWISSESKSKRSTNIISAAQKYLAAATWQWDKACILAGALLATTTDEKPNNTNNPPSEEFPYWVALDKHTEEGKTALRKISTQTKVGYRQLIWTSFYCESTQVNKQSKSPWFNAEKVWRLRKVGLSVSAAEKLWEKVSPLLQIYLEADAIALKTIIEIVPPPNLIPSQQSLL